MTLAELVARHEVAATPQPIDQQTVRLTDRGHACVALSRFVRQVRDLDAADRAYVLDMLHEELHELPVTA